MIPFLFSLSVFSSRSQQIFRKSSVAPGLVKNNISHTVHTRLEKKQDSCKRHSAIENGVVSVVWISYVWKDTTCLYLCAFSVSILLLSVFGVGLLQFPSAKTVKICSYLRFRRPLIPSAFYLLVSRLFCSSNEKIIHSIIWNCLEG